jgi:four helix bundle protein
MRDYKKYSIWMDSHQLTLSIYRLTKNYPKDETNGVISQIRRAMSSVPTNIAEGSGRDTDKDFKWFLTIAHASATEVEYWLLLSFELDYITKEDFTVLTDKIVMLRKQIHALIKKLTPANGY